MVLQDVYFMLKLDVPTLTLQSCPVLLLQHGVRLGVRPVAGTKVVVG